jgi:RNA polymerase sigma factor (sigma-70 family)
VRGDAPEEVVALFRREWPRLVGTLGLHTGDRGVAEDLAQEAFVRLCRHWEAVRDLDRPAGWLYRVAFNLAASHYRREGRERRRVPESATVTDQPDVAAAVAVRAALQDLPAAERAVLVLRFYGGLTLTEVAGVLEEPEGTVKTRSRRALARLREAGLDVEVEVVDA